MAITIKEIDGAKPTGKPYKLSDGRGLCLLIAASGGQESIGSTGFVLRHGPGLFSNGVRGAHGSIWSPGSAQFGEEFGGALCSVRGPDEQNPENFVFPRGTAAAMFRRMYSDTALSATDPVLRKDARGGDRRTSLRQPFEGIPAKWGGCSRNLVQLRKRSIVTYLGVRSKSESQVQL